MTAASASVDLDVECGDLTIAVVPGNTCRGEGEDRDGTGPNVNADGNSLSVRSSDDDRGWFGGLNNRETWRVSLPDSVRMDFNMDLNAGTSTVDLGGMSVEAVDVTLNAGAATMDLGSLRELGDLRIRLNAGSLDLTVPNESFEGSIEANAGAVSLCVPPGAALRLNTGESIVASHDYDGHGLVNDGSTWATPGFESAAVRIELDTRANAGSFSLNPEDGCGG